MDHKSTAEHLLDRLDRETLHISDDQIIAAAQVHATLALTEQAKRIADALEGAQDQPERGRDGRYRLNADLEGM